MSPRILLAGRWSSRFGSCTSLVQILFQPGRLQNLRTASANCGGTPNIFTESRLAVVEFRNTHHTRSTCPWAGLISCDQQLLAANVAIVFVLAEMLG